MKAGEIVECEKCKCKLAVVAGFTLDGEPLEPRPIWHYCLADHDHLGIHLGENGKIILDSNYNKQGV